MIEFPIILTDEQEERLLEKLEARLEAKYEERKIAESSRPLSVKEFAQRAGFHQQTVYRKLEEGLISRCKSDNGNERIRIPYSELERYLT